MADALDLDARLAAITPPTFVAGGVRYLGRLVSWEQYLAWAPRLDAISADLARSEPAIAALAEEMAAALFPDRPRRRWWGWRPPSAVRVLARAPAAVQWAACVSFFEALSTMLPQPTGPDADPPAPRAA